jgi:hypothetical protein
MACISGLHAATHTTTRIKGLLPLFCWLGPHLPAGSAIEPLDRSHRLAPFEVFTPAGFTELLWRGRRAGCGA